MNKLLALLLLSQGMVCSSFAYVPSSVVADVVPADAPTLVSARLVARGNAQTIVIGHTLQFTAYGTYSDGSVAAVPDSEANPIIAWDTSNHAVANISLLGHVSALGTGTISIEAVIGTITATPWTLTVLAATAGGVPATPSISPAAGTYATARTVVISDVTAQTTLYYTTDGSTPTTSSPVYTTPFTTSSSSAETVRALAVASGVSSDVASATYSISPALPAPVFSPASGSFSKPQTVTLSAPSPGTTIYYTTDGTAATTSSAVYSGTGIPVSTGRVVISAMVGAVAGYSQSPDAAQTYSIYPITPFISPAAGTYTTARTVKISDATEGSTIYYTTDGSAPTIASPVYTGPFSTPGTATTETVRAFAVNAGVYGSSTASTYVIAPLPIAPAPAITPATGNYSTTEMVSITDSLAGAKTFYTIDGTTPTGASPRYASPFALPSNQTGTYVVKAMTWMANYQWSPLTESDITLALPEGVIGTTTVNTTTPADTIATSFLGFAHDWGAAQLIMGDAALGVNHIYRTMVGTLTSEMNGPLLLRIANETQDTVTVNDITPLVEMAQASDVNYLMEVNLRSDDLALAEQQAQNYVSGMPGNILKAIEIGNEPDGYATNGARPSTYAYAEYLPNYLEWYQGITPLVQGVAIAGPTLGTGYWDSEAQADVADGVLPVQFVTQHKYVACYYADDPLPSNLLLQPSSSTASIWAIRPYAAAAHSVGAPFRMDEINSVCNGGQAGLSNSFSSALWAIDNMFEYANAGVDGVNWNTNDNNGPFDLFHYGFWNNGSTNLYSLMGVNPLFYGLSFFAQAAGNTAQLLTSSTLTDANIKVWVTRDSLGNAHLVIINKEISTSGTVQIALPGYSTGYVVRLTASTYLATTGLTMGGQTYDGSRDGTLLGTKVTEPASQSSGVWTIPVNAMSAVLVNLQP